MLQGIDHKSFTILPRTIATAAPEMAAEEMRADWESAAAFATIAPFGHSWFDAAADAFDAWAFGA